MQETYSFLLTVQSHSIYWYFLKPLLDGTLGNLKSPVPSSCFRPVDSEF